MNVQSSMIHLVRSTPLGRLSSTLAVALTLGLLLYAGIAPAHAQAGDPENAALADLASRTGLSTSELDVTRFEAVTWNDACLGAADDGELCAQVLTDGFVIWLDDGSTISRYHTNVDGSSLRFVTTDVALEDVRSAPLPDGASARDLPTSEPTVDPLPIINPTAGTVSEFLDALDEAGLPTALQEIAILRPEIGVPGAGQIPVDGSLIQIIDLGSVAAGEELVNALRSEGAVLSANVTYWVSGQIAVVLTEAPSNPSVEQTLSGILGSPVLLTIASPPPLLPGSDGDDAADQTGEVTPEALPATGDGGIGEDGGDVSVWVWIGVVFGVAALTVVAALSMRRRAGAR